MNLNEPLFIAQKMEKYVKKYVKDDERKEALFNQRKISEKQRKKYRKTKRKLLKGFKKTNTSYSSGPEDFDTFLIKWNKERDAVLELEIDIKLNAHKLILEAEWDLILVEVKEDLQKTIKRKNKDLGKLEKQYKKTAHRIKKSIESESNATEIALLLDSLYQRIENDIKTYTGYLYDKESIIYKYKVSEEELSETLDIQNELKINIFKSFKNAHFRTKELVDQKDWNKIIKEMSKLY